ncbi:MAG: hypothetical protein DHS20C20_22980 [Ardenticatenaceae bacterium]|nr:MAG: hypothetical protein DHS20C20_22980 [Ardenticatenaceae bacterium]
MSEPTSDKHVPRNAASWAQPVDRMTAANLPDDAINLNVTGRRPTSPLQGFGQLWQKTYRIRLDGTAVPPETLIREWKAQFPDFWPKGNRFFGSIGGVAPGDVAVLNVAGPGGMKLSTGIRVMYADDESFSFMTPEGHMFAGMITFSSFVEDDQTIAQIQALIRANDPVYEMGFRLGFGHKAEDAFWHQTMHNLAAHFDRTGTVTQNNVLVDKKVQWAEAKNIWQNAAIRTTIYMPIHLTKRLFKKA